MRLKCNIEKCTHNLSGYCHADEVNVDFDYPESTNAKIECDFEEYDRS
jgi:hypothetical protein